MKNTLAKAGISMKALVSSAALLGGAIIFGAVLTKFSASLDSIGQQFGSLKVLGSDFRNTLLDSNVEAIKVGGSLQDVSNITIALASNFGTNVDAAAELSGKVFDTSKAIGLSADEGANLFGVLMQTSNLSADQAEKLAEGTFQLARQAGVAPTAVMKDIANSSEVVATFTKDGGDNIAKAAVQARALGVGLETTAKIAEGLLDFESSISKEVEASVLIGKQLNFQKAREAALNGDIAGAMEEVVGQLGSEEEFNKLNLIQRKALADSIGVGVNELAKFVGQEEKVASLGERLAKSKAFEDLVGEDSLSALTNLLNSFKAIGAELTNALGPAFNFIAGVLGNIAAGFKENEVLMKGLIGVTILLTGYMLAMALATAYGAIAAIPFVGPFLAPVAAGLMLASAVSQIGKAKNVGDLKYDAKNNAVESSPNKGPLVTIGEESFQGQAGDSVVMGKQGQSQQGHGVARHEVNVVLPEAVPITIEGDTLRGFLQLETAQPLAGGDASYDNVGK